MLCFILCIFFLVYAFCAYSDSLSSVELPLTIMLSGSSSSVEYTCDKFLYTRKSFYSLSSVEKRVRLRCVLYQSFPFLQGNFTSWGNQLSSYTSISVLLDISNYQWYHFWSSSSHKFHKAISQTPWYFFKGPIYWHLLWHTLLFYFY